MGKRSHSTIEHAADSGRLDGRQMQSQRADLPRQLQLPEIAEKRPSVPHGLTERRDHIPKPLDSRNSGSMNSLERLQQHSGELR